MSGLSMIRMARRAVGLAPQASYPNLETLLETQAGEAHNDYHVLSLVLPPSIAFVGIVTSVTAAIKHPLFLLVTAGFVAGSIGLYFILDHLDKQIPRSRVRLRKLAEPIWGRYQGVLSAVGVEPAISPAVAEVLDEASKIYLRHVSNEKDKRKRYGEFYDRAVSALEEAMARMLELAEPKSISAQESELLSGWSDPLLQEMREMDSALDRHQQGGFQGTVDPLINLREARRELQNVESALRELEH